MFYMGSYFTWLQKDVPTGLVERYPEISQDYETSVKGVYIIGDLTGVPLLKAAAEGGVQLIRNFVEKNEFHKSTDENTFDVVIVGAGPAGISAALECKKEGLKYLVLETSQLFNTIENFPKGKLILAKPDELQQKSLLTIKDGNKESLLQEMKERIAEENLNVSIGEMVSHIKRTATHIDITTKKQSYKADKVLLAIGKSGNSRKLKVPGEELPKVFNKLYDPNEFENSEIMVVGGGDSALEASIALAEAGNHVTHSYRKSTFSRPKEENSEAFNRLVNEGKITKLFESQVKSIHAQEVFVDVKGEEKCIKNDYVFTLIGRELPLAFFKRSGIKMAGEKDLSWWVFLVAMVSFFTMLYYGKSGFGVNLFKDSTSVMDAIGAYLIGPFSVKSSWAVDGYSWYASINFYLGWIGSLVWIITGLWAFSIMTLQKDKYFGSTWNRIKYTYLTVTALFFTYVYFSSLLSKSTGWAYEPTYYYSLLYCTTMALFAVRRAMVKKSRYVKYQMITLVSIQVLFLFLLPYHLYDTVIAKIFSPDSYVIKEMFPQGKWSSFGFVLLWPLNISNFGTSTFWTWFPFVQTFGILLFIVLKWGKGIYCGWICSCGGMAETLGDEYREKSPHGPTAKKLENIGQWVLLYAFVMTAVAFLHKKGILADYKTLADTLVGTYKFTIDVFFAGVLGLGVYFFMGGRIWCRFGCPLAALMHIYTRFSRYRIVAEKKKCISCNTCTKVCHMGIDVMNFANKGIPMNDVECVRCSTCITSCPTDVLAFAELPRKDVDNVGRTATPSYSKDDWKAGIK